jgi:hypothetical protein
MLSQRAFWSQYNTDAVLYDDLMQQSFMQLVLLPSDVTRTCEKNMDTF